MGQRVVGMLAAIGALALWLPACTEETLQLPFTDAEIDATVDALRALLWLNAVMATDLEAGTDITDRDCPAGGSYDFFPPIFTRPQAPGVWQFDDCFVEAGGWPLVGFTSAVSLDLTGTVQDDFAVDYAIDSGGGMDSFVLGGTGSVMLDTPPRVLLESDVTWSEPGFAGSVLLVMTDVTGSSDPAGPALMITASIPQQEETPGGSTNAKFYTCQFGVAGSDTPPVPPVFFPVLGSDDDYLSVCTLAPRPPLARPAAAISRGSGERSVP
jgi:hypothetical protein